ncbi:MAG: hypothetical protein DDT23_01151 [candidate division WS2 bacterium]|nr:hypothetical protein [Candidatus Lithacetigena glycinireducens]
MAYLFADTSLTMAAEEGNSRAAGENSAFLSFNRTTLSLKYMCVPETASRESKTIGLSSQPNSFQLLINPWNIKDNCSRVKFSIGLPGLTITERPSKPTLISNGSIPFSLAAAISSVLIVLDDWAISVVPSIKAFMPTPEPPPATEIFTLGCWSINFSAQLAPKSTMVSDPFILIEPDNSSIDICCRRHP